MARSTPPRTALGSRALSGGVAVTAATAGIGVAAGVSAGPAAGVGSSTGSVICSGAGVGVRASGAGSLIDSQAGRLAIMQAAKTGGALTHHSSMSDDHQAPSASEMPNSASMSSDAGTKRRVASKHEARSSPRVSRSRPDTMHHWLSHHARKVAAAVAIQKA